MSWLEIVSGICLLVVNGLFTVWALNRSEERTHDHLTRQRETSNNLSSRLTTMSGLWHTRNEQAQEDITRALTKSATACELAHQAIVESGKRIPPQEHILQIQPGFKVKVLTKQTKQTKPRTSAEGNA